MVQQVKAQAARSGAFVLGAQRPGGTPLYWFAARDDAQLESIVNAFVKADAPFVGVRFVTR